MRLVWTVDDVREGKRTRVSCASPVIFEGFEEFSFAIHRPLRRRKGWTVSEGISGFRISRDCCDTQEQAIESAQANLDKSSPDDLRERIKKAKGGTS